MYRLRLHPLGFRVMQLGNSNGMRDSHAFGQDAQPASMSMGSMQFGSKSEERMTANSGSASLDGRHSLAPSKANQIAVVPNAGTQLRTAAWLGARDGLPLPRIIQKPRLASSQPDFDNRESKGTRNPARKPAPLPAPVEVLFTARAVPGARSAH